LGQVIGQCEALTLAPNVVERNRTKGVARLQFRVTRAARMGGVAVTVCYMLFCLYLQ